MKKLTRYNVYANGLNTSLAYINALTKEDAMRELMAQILTDDKVVCFTISEKPNDTNGINIRTSEKTDPNRGFEFQVKNRPTDKQCWE